VPKTGDGLARLTAARTTHGKYTKNKRAVARRYAEQGRQMRAELAELEEWFVDHGHLDRTGGISLNNGGMPPFGSP